MGAGGRSWVAIALRAVQIEPTAQSAIWVNGFGELSRITTGIIAWPLSSVGTTIILEGAVSAASVTLKDVTSGGSAEWQRRPGTRVILATKDWAVAVDSFVC